MATRVPGVRRLSVGASRAWHQLLATGASAAPLPIRLILALIFFAHGAQKLFGWFGGPGLSAAGEGFEAMGFSPGALMAFLAGAIEVFGALALAAGLLTRVAAAFLTVEMLVAMFAVHWRHGFFLAMAPGQGNGIEFVLALLAGLFALLITGGGRWSLDRELTR